MVIGGDVGGGGGGGGGCRITYCWVLRIGCSSGKPWSAIVT